MLSGITSRTYKRHQLLNRLLLLTAGAAGLHAFVDLFQSSQIVVLINSLIMGWMLLLYILNKKRFSKLAGYGFLISASIIILVYGSVVPPENGVNLLFLPLMSVVFVLFEYQQHLAKISISLFILSCFLLLEFSDYRLMGELQLMEEPDPASFIINFVSSGIFLYLALNFITLANNKAEQHLQLMAEEVQQQNQLLSKTNEELDRFVYSTSHDLRAPLLSVKGLVQLMENPRANEPIQPYLHMMVNRLDSLLTFISDITTYSRNARLPLEPCTLHVPALVQEVFENHRFNMLSQPALRQEGELSKPLIVDRQRLLTVLNNLVSNAIKYHRIQVPNPFVAVGYRLEGEQLHLWVADNGSGIPAAVQVRMFEMFYRGDERSCGSGLGLYIAKEAVQKLGGRIEVQSEVDKGTTFHVWVPVGIGTASEEPAVLEAVS